MFRRQEATTPPLNRKEHPLTWSHCDRRPSPLRRCVTSEAPGAVSALSGWISGRCSMMKGLLQSNLRRSLRKTSHSNSVPSHTARSTYTINLTVNDTAHMGHHCNHPISAHRSLLVATSRFKPNLPTRIPKRVQALIPSRARAPAHIVY